LVGIFGEDWEGIGKGMVLPARSCKDHYRRYMNFKKGPWKRSEEDKLRELVGELGPRRAHIAEMLGTKRSALDVRNKWRKIKNIRPWPTFPPQTDAALDDDLFHFDEDL
jgi:hypothetical protein